MTGLPALPGTAQPIAAAPAMTRFLSVASMAGLQRRLAIDDLMQVENFGEILELARRQLPRLFPDRSG